MWSLGLRTGSQKSESQSPSHIELETRGQKLLEKIASAPHKEPLGVTLAMLAWTAGPVTLFTAWCATWIGYGVPLSPERVLYFFVYSIVTGVLGILTKVIYNVIHGHQSRYDEHCLLDVTDRLPEIIYMVRDLRLANLTPDNRRIESAGIILRKFDLGPEWIASAIEDLTGDRELAYWSERIEQFRRAGLYTRMQDLISDAADKAQRHTHELRQSHPRIAVAMSARLNGMAPDIRRGQPRERLFLERILAAIDEENAELITLPDVEHMLALCFELICGRQITYLKVEYTGGDWNLTKALDRLERYRNDYRISRARVYSRLRALTAYLDFACPAKDIQSASGLGIKVLLASGIDGLNRLVQHVNEHRRHINQTGYRVDDLQEALSHLEKAVELYKKVRESWQQESRDNRRFVRSLQVWQHRSRNWQASADGSLLKRSLLISEQHILLSDEDKVEVARELRDHIKSAGIRRYSRRSHNNETIEDLLTVEKAKGLAIETLLILDSRIDLHQPEIQRAIDDAPLSTMAPLEPGMSPMTKAALGKAMADAIVVDVDEMAEKLAQNLIRYYRVPLGEETIDFLVRHYGANKERLEFIAKHEAPRPPQNSIRDPIIEVPDVMRHWKSTLYNARRTLALHK